MKAVLFDLDGTLLDIRIDDFLGRYFAALEVVFDQVADSANCDPKGMMRALLDSTNAMARPHPAQTNKEVFRSEFLRLTGIDIDQEHQVFDDFYRDRFPSLRHDEGPNQGGRSAVEAAKGLGMRVAVATNPIFPRAAIEHRIAWAGLADVDFDLVTTYEDMHSCKPHGAYYAEIAALLGVEPRDCLMVGDDPGLDLPAADIGMRTFLVGNSPSGSADYSGTLLDLAALLPRLSDGREAIPLGGLGDAPI